MILCHRGASGVNMLGATWLQWNPPWLVSKHWWLKLVEIGNVLMFLGNENQSVPDVPVGKTNSKTVFNETLVSDLFPVDFPALH